MTAEKATPLRCEALKCDRQRCQHLAKYLVPYNSSVVCGIHRRAFLRCIPLAELVNTSAVSS